MPSNARCQWRRRGSGSRLHRTERRLRALPEGSEVPRLTEAALCAGGTPARQQAHFPSAARALAAWSRTRPATTSRPARAGESRPAAGGVGARRPSASCPVRWSSLSHMSCCSGSAKPPDGTQLGRARATAAKSPTCTPGCWPPTAAAPEARAAWHEALASLGPVDGPDVRGMPTEGCCTCETPTRSRPHGHRSTSAMSSARSTPVTATPASQSPRRRRSRCRPQTRTRHRRRHQDLAASYQALHGAYRQREDVFTAAMADRADWEAATRQQRHLAVAADAELRLHPDQRFSPLCSAEPEPATQVQRDELTLTAGGSRSRRWASGSWTSPSSTAIFDQPP